MVKKNITIFLFNFLTLFINLFCFYSTVDLLRHTETEIGVLEFLKIKIFSADLPGWMVFFRKFFDAKIFPMKITRP